MSIQPSQDEARRLAALHSYAVLDTLPEQAYDDITFIAARICGTPIALVSLVDEHRQWFKSRVGLEATETPRDVAFCAHAIRLPDEVMVVPDATRDQRFADSPLVQNAPEIRFYAGAPLVTPDGQPLGTLCVIDRVPRELDAEQLACLRALSRQVMAQLELRAGLKRLGAQTVRLEESRRELERSNQELDDFAYIASHDLKEPLRGIQNYSAFLLEDYEDRLEEDGRIKLRTLGRLANRLGDLIDSLLRFSRVGRAELAVVETDLNVVLEEVVDSLHISLQEDRVAVRIPKPLPCISCDAPAVSEIFRNLISNAMKNNDKPERWIEVGFGPPPPDRDAGPCPPVTPSFYVRDNGIGILEKHQEKIFDLFKRLHGRGEFGGGTGAGLCIVKKLVERHGGRIWVDSVRGEGTTFRFILQGATA